MDVQEQYHLLESKFAALVGKQVFTKDHNLKLERIACLLDLLGNPQQGLAVIHVGGTSGKGSTATTIGSILHRHGYRTGVFLSPYVQVINEICCIDGCPANTSALLAAFNSVQPHFDAVAKRTGMGAPSYFEVKLAVALLLFRQMGVDVAVIEVGIGGSFDATNVLTGDVAVLVSVGLDHTEILGDSVEQIASDKVGIIKPNAIAVCGFRQPSTRAIAQVQARSQGAKLLLLDEDFSVTHRDGALTLHQPDTTVALPASKQAQHQIHNTALAIIACQQWLGSHNRQLDPHIVCQALGSSTMPGRAEVVQDSPMVILDGAHNPDKLTAFFQSIRQYANPILVVALKQGREVNAQIFPVLQRINAKHLIATSFANKGIWQAVPAEQLLAQCCAHPNPTTTYHCHANPDQAIRLALQLAVDTDVIAVTGSLFLVGEIRGHWYPQRQLLQQLDSRFAQIMACGSCD